MKKYRTESDLLGEKRVPEDAYYGIQTLRAIENFKISRQRIGDNRHLIHALACVKKACAMTNYELGLLPENIFQAIVAACDSILSGNFHDQFPIDIYQGGAGTSTNMNANEVIANIALERLGYQKGAYEYLSPNDHVNLSQSTNDAYPTALKLSAYSMHVELVSALEKLQHALEQKASEFISVIKMGRTQLQDAVPMTLGQEFEGFSHLISRAVYDLNKSANDLLEVNMGATAIGTGINAPDGFDMICARNLAELTQTEIYATQHMIAVTSDTSAFVEYSGGLKKCALRLIKICNDLRLLSSGPRTGLYEIVLPAMQPGSSIMPGKVNPVVPELMNQICYKVIGNDLTVTLASENAQLQLNVMEPVMAASLFESIRLLTNGLLTLTTDCIIGITANKEHSYDKVMNSIGIVTALNPVLGYKMCTLIAREALEQNKSVKEIVLEKKLMSEEELKEHLDLYKMIQHSHI